MWALSPLGKFQMGGGDIGDALMQVIAAGGLDALRLVPRQRQNHGDVVRGERPEDVFLPPDLAQVQPVGVDVVDPPQFPGRGKFLELDEGRVVLQQVPHHQDPAAFFGDFDQLLAFRFVQNERFFHIDVLAGQKGFARQEKMRFRRGGDHHTLDVVTLQNVGQRVADLDAGVLAL